MPQKPVHAFWYTSNNFGDALTPWLLRKAGWLPTFTPIASHKNKMLLSGSILSEADNNCVVWGVGVGSITQVIKEGVDIRAVRGPISHLRAIQHGVSCPPTYGDSGLALPKFYAPKIEKRYAVGVVPHYIDQEIVFHSYKDESRDDVLFIDINGPIEKVIDEVVACRQIVSSSLHGLVVAQAYEVPWTWVKFSDEIAGDGVKFTDFFLSVKIDPHVPIDLVAKLPPIDRYATIPRRLGTYNSEPLWKAFPCH